MDRDYYISSKGLTEFAISFEGEWIRSGAISLAANQTFEIYEAEDNILRVVGRLQKELDEMVSKDEDSLVDDSPTLNEFLASFNIS